MKNPLIVALDVESEAQARRLVSALGESVEFYKVGLELYASAGMPFVRALVSEGKQVFLDLKFYDIAETVKRAVAQVAASGARFLTVHARGQVMRAAVEGKSGSSLQILAVTVLTNLDETDLDQDGYRGPVSELVDKRTHQAIDCGVDGLVCSPREVVRVRRITGLGKILVTPGVRSAGVAAGDQKRIATPEQALADGADYLVIGREVTRAADPAAEVHRILSAISTAGSPARA